MRKAYRMRDLSQVDFAFVYILNCVLMKYIGRTKFVDGSENIPRLQRR